MDLEKLNKNDLYSLSMFLLYKLTDVKEYSIIGELPYILDRKDLINFCNYFGGRTIKVPTLAELYNLMNVVQLYQYVNVDKIPYNDAITKIGFKKSELKRVHQIYLELIDILDKYNFSRGNDNV